MLAIWQILNCAPALSLSYRWDRVMGELAVSRAIGDHCLRPYVIPTPEVTRVVRRPDDQLLILASDGLWDVIGNQEACNIAHQAFNKTLASTGSLRSAVKKAAAQLAHTAVQKGTRDNVTVLIVDVRVGVTPLLQKLHQIENHKAGASGVGSSGAATNAATAAADTSAPSDTAAAAGGGDGSPAPPT